MRLAHQQEHQHLTKQQQSQYSSHIYQQLRQLRPAVHPRRASQRACHLAAMATADQDAYERVAVLAAKEAGVCY